MASLSVGTVEETGPLGVRMGLSIPIGMPPISGPIATGSGLVFFVGSMVLFSPMTLRLARRSGNHHSPLEVKERLPLIQARAAVSSSGYRLASDVISPTAGTM